VFMLLMQELFFIAQKTATSLRSMLKKFRIDAFPGENNKSVSTTLMSISRRLWYSKDHSFPSELLNTILKLYQTNSVPEFNAHFSSITTDRQKEFADSRVAFLPSTTVTTPSTLSQSNDLDHCLEALPNQ
jgi:hypothetical protein